MPNLSLRKQQANSPNMYTIPTVPPSPIIPANRRTIFLAYAVFSFCFLSSPCSSFLWAESSPSGGGWSCKRVKSIPLYNSLHYKPWDSSQFLYKTDNSSTWNVTQQPVLIIPVICTNHIFLNSCHCHSMKLTVLWQTFSPQPLSVFNSQKRIPDLAWYSSNVKVIQMSF